jgi:hypothetical protein
MTTYRITVRTYSTGGFEKTRPQVGHAFITPSASGKPDITIGYYPIVHGSTGPGTLRDDMLTGESDKNKEPTIAA